MDTYLNQSNMDDFSKVPVCKSDVSKALGIYEYFNQGYLDDYSYIPKVAETNPTKELGVYNYFNQGFLDDFSYVPRVGIEEPHTESLRVSLITLTPLYLAPML